MSSLEVLFTPADFAALGQRDLSSNCCVVFDVLRATSSMTVALWNGATAILPVEEIADALAAADRLPGALLAGERQGRRIGWAVTGGKEFDLGNSPREFTTQAVRDRQVIMSTTNGTRALRACKGARRIFAGSLLNLSATAQAVLAEGRCPVIVVCSGTFEEAAYEDTLAAGALCDEIWGKHAEDQIADSARMARELFLAARNDLAGAVGCSRNGRRLLAQPDLHDDVAFCLQRDAYPLVANMDSDGFVRRQKV